MAAFHKQFAEYKKRMIHGAVREAYRGIIKFMMDLRTRFEKEFPDLDVSGALYPGCMDMTFFCIVPDFLKPHKLKIAVLFLHDTCRFEVWLAAANRLVQDKYWKLFKESGYSDHPLTAPGSGVDSIVCHVAADDPDFSDLTGLTKIIEKEVFAFEKSIRNFVNSLA
jgi:hypothetical protein